MSDQTQPVATTRLELGPAGELRAVQTAEPVRVRPAFPLSRPSGPLLVFDMNERLLDTIMDAGALPEAVREACRGGVPTIEVERVCCVRGQGDAIFWEVETRDGLTRFESDDRGASCTALADGGCVVLSRSGECYRFRDLAAMDEASRWEAEHYLQSSHAFAPEKEET